MTLSFGKSSPQDMLAKAQRDLDRLAAAEASEDDEAMSDALFDLAVSLTSIKDWVKEHPSATFSRHAVEQYVAASTALASFRDIANGGKHRIIRNYAPTTESVSVSAVTPVVDPKTIMNRLTGQYPRLKIIRSDGSRHRAVELGTIAVQEWRDFISQHRVT